MNPSEKIRFGSFLLDRDNARLARDGKDVPLTPKSLDVLHYLASRPDQLVTKAQLLEGVWGDVIVGDTSVKVCIREIRKALRDDAEKPQFIQTVYRRGYRFIASAMIADTPAGPKGQSRDVGANPMRGLQAVDPRPLITVGRLSEMAALQRAFESAAAGRGSMVCITGEPGMGKTTLVEEFLVELRERRDPCRIARGRCSERLSGTEAYFPLLDALDSLVRSDAAGYVTGVIEAVAPAWYAELAPARIDAPAGAQAATQQRINRELVALFEKFTSEGPLLLFLDDVHWADTSTVDMLAYVGGRCSGMGLLLVTTYRPSELKLSKHPFGSVQLELQRHGVCSEVSLSFLGREDVASYLDLAFPGNRFEADFANLIYTSTEGNPLFLVDLLRYLRDRGTIAESGSGGWALAQAMPDFAHDLPASVRCLIQKKLERMSGPEHRLLSAASVQGCAFDSATVAHMSAIDVATVEEELDALDRIHRLVRRREEAEFPDGSATVRYQFVHVLYQNALYASLQPARRAAWSAAAANALAGHYREQRVTIAGELARLFETARDWANAVEYFALDAQNAMRVSAHHEAAILSRRALALLERLPDTPQRARQELTLRLGLGVSLIATISFAAPDVRDTYTRARALCRQIDDLTLLFPALYGMWNFHLVRCELGPCRDLAEQMFSLAQRERDPVYRMLGHTVLQEPAFHAGDFVAARRHQQQGLDLYNASQHGALTAIYGEDPGLGCEVYGAVTLWHLGYPEQAVRAASNARDRARNLPNPFNLARTLYFGAYTHQCCQDVSAVREWTTALLDLCTDQGFAMLTAGATILLGWVDAREGACEEGVSRIQQGLEAWAATGALSHRPWHLALLAEALGLFGKTNDALVALGEAQFLCSSTGERFYEGEIIRLRGHTLLKSASSSSSKLYDEAEACFERSLAIARSQQAKSQELKAALSLARLQQETARCPQALDALAEIYGRFTEGLDSVDLKATKALLVQAAAAS